MEHLEHWRQHDADQKLVKLIEKQVALVLSAKTSMTYEEALDYVEESYCDAAHFGCACIEGVITAILAKHREDNDE